METLLRCPRCWKHLRQEARFCSRCGKQLGVPLEPRLAPACDASCGPGRALLRLALAAIIFAMCLMTSRTLFHHRVDPPQPQHLSEPQTATPVDEPDVAWPERSH